MRIALAFEVPCTVETAWHALHDTDTVSRLYGPLLGMRPLASLPKQFADGDRVVVELRALNVLPLGRQAIEITDTVALVGGVGGVGGVETRSMHDTGGPLSGPLAPVKNWHHTMSLSPAPGNPRCTQWSDTLEFGGALGFAYWPALFLTWRLRAARIKKLSKEW